MKKEDARSLPAAAQEEKRKQAVRLRKRGETYAAIAEVVGVHERTVIRWIRTWEKEGTAALKSRKRGRPSGAGRLLTPEQEKELRKSIEDKTPDQLKMPYVLWTREAVKELIEQKYSIRIAIRTVGKYSPCGGSRRRSH